MSAGTEVERTFVCGTDTLPKIEAAGGRSLGAKTISDTYFDSSDFALIRSNFWLRQRNCQWELKYPLDGMYEGRSTSVYHEVQNESEIETLVKDRLPESSEVNLSLGEMVSSGLLKPFCNLITHRRSFKLEDDVTIVLDFEENLEHYVGEIEIMVLDPALVGEAVARIDRWTEILSESGDFRL